MRVKDPKPRIDLAGGYLAGAAVPRGERVNVEDSDLPAPAVSYDPDGPDGDRWRLVRAYVYADRGTVLRVPAGFTFDLASVPRAAWVAIAPFELSIVAPLLHDALYRHGGALPRSWCTPYRTYTRGEADALFRRVMEREGIGWWRRWSAYAAVRAFGRGSWRE